MNQKTKMIAGDNPKIQRWNVCPNRWRTLNKFIFDESKKV